MSEIKLKIDLSTGLVSIESSSDDFLMIMDRAESLISSFKGIAIIDRNPPPAPADNDQAPQNAENGNHEEAKPPSKAKVKRGSGGAKTANWSMVDDLLDEAGRQSLKEFFAIKSPSTQNEKVAVLAVHLMELSKKDRFDGNEIYTAFQIVGEKTPGNLSAVFGNMATEGLGKTEDKKFVPNFKAKDLVKLELPKKVGIKNDKKS